MLEKEKGEGESDGWKRGNGNVVTALSCTSAREEGEGGDGGGWGGCADDRIGERELGLVGAPHAGDTRP